MAAIVLRAYHSPMTVAPEFRVFRLAQRLVVLSLLVFGSMGQARAATPIKLIGEVGPGFNITLKKGSNRVVTLKAGSYVITVKDRATNHNFRLRGPGLNRATQVSRIETKTWTVTLRPGTYTYLCDPHPTQMKASFKVIR